MASSTNVIFAWNFISSSQGPGTAPLVDFDVAEFHKMCVRRTLAAIRAAYAIPSSSSSVGMQLFLETALTIQLSFSDAEGVQRIGVFPSDHDLSARSTSTRREDFAAWLSLADSPRNVTRTIQAECSLQPSKRNEYAYQLNW
jgi:hypothetical protein